LTTEKRLTTKQNGSKKWHSTETSLLRTTNTFLKGIDNKKLTACVLLDMDKALIVLTTKYCYENYKTLAPHLVCANGLTAISQIDIKLYEFTPLFPVQYQLNMEYLRVASWAPYYLVYTLMIYRKLHEIALLNAM